MSTEEQILEHLVAVGDANRLATSMAALLQTFNVRKRMADCEPLVRLWCDHHEVDTVQPDVFMRLMDKAVSILSSRDNELILHDNS